MKSKENVPEKSDTVKVDDNIAKEENRSDHAHSDIEQNLNKTQVPIFQSEPEPSYNTPVCSFESNNVNNTSHSNVQKNVEVNVNICSNVPDVPVETPNEPDNNHESSVTNVPPPTDIVTASSDSPTTLINPPPDNTNGDDHDRNDVSTIVLYQCSLLPYIDLHDIFVSCCCFLRKCNNTNVIIISICCPHPDCNRSIFHFNIKS